MTLSQEENCVDENMNEIVEYIQCPGGGGGVLPYMNYTGTCRWIGYGFWLLSPEQGI